MLTAMLDSKHRGRRKGVAIREGTVRQARLEAGLSLAQVAEGEVTRTAIHLIEHGRIRPSFETLQLIARRTRRPLAFFLLQPNESVPLSPAQAELRDLEQLTLSRAFDQVTEKGSRLLSKRRSKSATAFIHFHVGQAYCRLVQPVEALQHLGRARAYFEQAGDEWLSVEAMDWEAAALGLQEDPAALFLAHEALERCRKLAPKPLQTEARILGHIASMYVVGHSWAQAARYYETAAEAAGKIKDLLQEAKMHHGLGMVYQHLQQPVKARQHFDRAVALYSIEADQSALYRVENDLGYLLLHEGQLDSAEEHLLTALTGCDALQIDRRGRGFILNSLGELNLRRGQLAVATQCLRQALDAGNATGEKLVLAESHSLLGQVAELQDNRSGADRHFATALLLLEQLDMLDRLRDCHMDYAKMLDVRGHIALAEHHWRLAAEVGKLAASGLKWNPAVSAGSPGELSESARIS
jgi:tetratricopeptide (TPR) repeat protein